MQHTNQPQTTINSNDRDASVQINIDEMSAQEILEALRFSLSMEGLRSLTTIELVAMQNICHHWGSLAGAEITIRNHGSSWNNNPKPWVIVENPGTDDENIVIDFATYREACRWIDRNYTDDDCPADILRRLDDGTLTTEY